MEDTIIVVQDKIDIKDLQKKAEELYGLMVKSVVDVNQKILAVGGELHSDAEQILLEQGSLQENLWGINLYPFETDPKRLIEYDSLINIRPQDNNFSMSIENKELRKQVNEVVLSLINFNDHQVSSSFNSRKI